MGFSNWVNMTLRASAITVGTSEQSTAVTIPETVTSMWVLVTKTAEFNADNLLTVRIQGQVNSLWFDLAWDSIQETGTLSTAADTATVVVRTPNIVDASSTAPTYSVLAHYLEVPSNVLRVASVTSGTAPVNTFSVEAYFQLNKL